MTDTSTGKKMSLWKREGYLSTKVDVIKVIKNQNGNFQVFEIVVVPIKLFSFSIEKLY